MLITNGPERSRQALLEHKKKPLTLAVTLTTNNRNEIFRSSATSGAFKIC